MSYDIYRVVTRVRVEHKRVYEVEASSQDEAAANVLLEHSSLKQISDEVTGSEKIVDMDPPELVA